MTEKSDRMSALKWLVGVAVIIAAAAAGTFLGGLFKGDATVEAQPTESFDVFTNLSLHAGDPFPDITLHDLNYAEVSSTDILHEQGTVVLFMEPNCPPCHSLAIDWQKAVENNVIDPDQVVGISYSDANRLKEMLANYEVSFRLYADPTYAFMDQFGVDGFPLILVVNPSGTITYVDNNPYRKISSDQLTALLTD